MTTPWPFRHFGLKLLSVGMATLLWMIVSGEENVERGLTIPIELQQIPQGLEMQTKPPSTVDVRVRGGSGTLSRLSPVDIVAVMDLHGALAGQRLFHLTPDQVRVPFGVEVVQITPPTIALVFENSATKFVPVVPPIDGKPAPGFVVGRITSDPAAVEIVGPESSVKRAAAALTEPVSVANARDRVRGTVTVGVLDSSLRLKNTRSAIVDVQIMPAPVERAFHGLPVRGRDLAAGLTARFTPATVDVSVRGSREGLNRFGADDVSVSVDLKDLGVGQYSLRVHAESEREAGVSRIDPDTVQVQISK